MDTRFYEHDAYMQCLIALSRAWEMECWLQYDNSLWVYVG